MCHLRRADLQPQGLVKLQCRDWLCIDTRIVQQSLMPGFRCQVCRLVKLKLMDCLKHRFRGRQLLPNLHLQRRLARRGDYRCPCWLTYMFQYLPHRRRLCDEPNQAHPPAAPVTLERKYPVFARQQLCQSPKSRNRRCRPRRHGQKCQGDVRIGEIAPAANRCYGYSISAFNTPRRATSSKAS